MKTYEWVLFDADDTLFHFDAFSGLQRMFSRFNLQFTEKDYEKYQQLNKSLWKDYQDGLILDAQVLKQQRFKIWSEKLNIPPAELNSAFLDAMADICVPIAGAIHLLELLKPKSKLGIITNGFTELQEIRLERTGLKHYFDILVISEKVGMAKPQLGIFEHALSLMGNPDRKNVLMVGDTLESDIIGGINAGLDTCWINKNNRPLMENIVPNYHVSSLKELKNLLK